MQSIGEFGRQEAIDEAVPFDAALSFKLARDHPDAIVRTPTFARAGVARVSVGFVYDIEKNRVERRCQTRDNSLLHSQRSKPPVKRTGAYISNAGMGAPYRGLLAPLPAPISAERFGACPMASPVIKVMAWI